MTWLIYESTRNTTFCLAFVLLFPIIGKVLPKDLFAITNSKYHNSHFYHVLPLIANILAGWLFLVYTWQNYR
jgi:hypothetical protein